MPPTKKRPSKNAKAALKILNDSKLLADAKAAEKSNAETNFENEPAPKVSSGIKPRPDKKRG